MLWDNSTRARYRRNATLYPSDLTDREWAVIEPFLPAEVLVTMRDEATADEVWDQRFSETQDELGALVRRAKKKPCTVMCSHTIHRTVLHREVTKGFRSNPRHRHAVLWRLR